MKNNTWVYWFVFALMMAISSYNNEGTAREYFDAMICFMCVVAARIEFIIIKAIKHKDT